MIGSRKNFNTNRLVRKNYANDARFKILIERPIWALAVSHFNELLQQNAEYYNHSIEIPVNLFAQILRYLNSEIFFLSILNNLWSRHFRTPRRIFRGESLETEKLEC